MRYLLGFLVLAVVFCLLVLPLRRVTEEEYATSTAVWEKNELQLRFAGSFHDLQDKRWPRGVKRGSPYLVSVSLVGLEQVISDLSIEHFTINGPPLTVTLPPKSKDKGSRDVDGKYYTIIAYDAVELDADLLRVDVKCIHAGSNRVFSFDVRRATRTRWVNAIWQALMGV